MSYAPRPREPIPPPSGGGVRPLVVLVLMLGALVIGALAGAGLGLAGGSLMSSSPRSEAHAVATAESDASRLRDQLRSRDQDLSALQDKVTSQQQELDQLRQRLGAAATSRPTATPGSPRGQTTPTSGTGTARTPTGVAPGTARADTGPRSTAGTPTRGGATTPGIPTSPARSTASATTATSAPPGGATAPGTLDRPYLGVKYVPPDARPASAEPGVEVATVVPGSGAARAGLRPGDLIVAVDGEAVDGPDALMQGIARHEVGDRISLRIQRDGVSFDAEVVLGSRPLGSPTAP